MPSAEESLPEILRFGSTTYFGYDRHGMEGLFALGAQVRAEWDREHLLPEDLDALRAVLFFEARRWHFANGDPDAESEAFIRAVVAQIQRNSGGRVSADHEGPATAIRRLRNRLTLRR